MTTLDTICLWIAAAFVICFLSGVSMPSEVVGVIHSVNQYFAQTHQALQANALQDLHTSVAHGFANAHHSLDSALSSFIQNGSVSGS